MNGFIADFSIYQHKLYTNCGEELNSSQSCVPGLAFKKKSKFDLKLDDGRERDFDDIICDFLKKYTWFSIGHGLWSTLGRYICIYC